VLEHRTFKHLGFGLGLNYFFLDANVDTVDYQGKASLEYLGPLLYLKGYF
jgi:hypothetical protein